MSLPSSPRHGATILWATLHSAEGARTVGSLFDFFNRNQNASSHAGADGYQLSGPWVPDELAAWTLLNGNPRSLNLELCGFAHWTREQWLSEGWVDGVWNPRQMIRNAAAWVRQKCDRHNIPKRWLTLDQIRRGERGIIMHADYTYATGDGDHTDLGKNFPRDVLLSDVNGSGGTTGDDEMLGDERNAVISTHAAIYYKGGAQGDQSIIERLVELQLLERGNSRKLDELLGRSPVEVDESDMAELATALAPLLIGLPDDKLDALSEMVSRRTNDERDRRERDRLAVQP